MSEGHVTTHVLDLALGKPAAGIRIELWRLSDRAGLQTGVNQLLLTTITNEDGRVDSPLLVGEACRPGLYLLVFYVEEYFREQGAYNEGIPFLNRIPIEFGIEDATAHYHIPLLVAPGGYSTYRGS
ncbi:MAG: hydroxyisourate hydrolase [Gorillibacterium sp.]|nr:hydroxyisourate hydrolase [Gorillibacterium sp.]